MLLVRGIVRWWTWKLISRLLIWPSERTILQLELKWTIDNGALLIQRCHSRFGFPLAQQVGVDLALVSFEGDLARPLLEFC